MANIDFKISEVRRGGGVTDVRARFYKGAVVAAEEPDENGDTVQVDRYQRTEKIGEKVFVLRGDVSDEDINAMLKAEIFDLSVVEEVEPISVQRLDAEDVETERAKVDTISKLDITG